MAATTNTYKRFRQLFGGHSRTIAEVLHVDSDGTSIVEARNGETFRVRGSSWPVGVKVWVIDAEIKSEAPDLPVYTAII